MRPPVGRDTQDFNSNWYVALGFGTPQPYGLHEAVDLNLKSGGDSDLGEPLYAIADGEVTSVHDHATGFGKHVHIFHPSLNLYTHYAHCQDILVSLGNKVSEGQIIGHLGKSGTSVAHLHFAIKRQPTGIDGVAKTAEDLTKWLDPEAFFKQHLTISNQSSPMIDEYSGLDLTNIESMRECARVWADVRDGKYVALKEVQTLQDYGKELSQELLEAKNSLSELREAVKPLTPNPTPAAVSEALLRLTEPKNTPPVVIEKGLEVFSNRELATELITRLLGRRLA